MHANKQACFNIAFVVFLLGCAMQWDVSKLASIVLVGLACGIVATFLNEDVS